MSARTTLTLNLAEYADREATFENEYGDVSLVLPFPLWEAIGQPGDVRVTVEAER